MTAQWSLPFSGFPGGFASWLPRQAADMVSGATPMLALAAFLQLTKAE